MIPISQAPIFPKELLMAFLYGRLSARKKTLLFQDSISEYLSCENIYITNSGSLALLNLFKYLNIKKGDEVLLPAYFCDKVAYLCKLYGARLKFVDTSKGSYNMDPSDLYRKLTDRTKVVVPAHMFGIPCSIDEITDICHDRNIFVIEDAAQAFGAEYNNLKVGTIGNAGIFSLGVGKPITTINGGFICTHEKDVVEMLDRIDKRKDPSLMCELITTSCLLGHSFTSNRLALQFIYRLLKLGNFKSKLKCEFMFNECNITEFQAAVGVYQLKKLDLYNKVRSQNALYIINQSLNPRIHFPDIPKNSKPIFLRLPLYIEGASRTEISYILGALRKAGVEATTYTEASLPVMFDNDNNTCPNASNIAVRTITLPTHPMVSVRDLENITKILNRGK